ncbi:hypothetical protein OKA05_25980 [Luteolibacter arcticus]|uniref:SecDF P1 head subdomain domain-containing protein n=1 Tax=Luteolibacter arcticus TaxID=1581411 RepID=A0ABT3GR84_9BACT|nr:hypothetical protein [Luteolibacter arcticus]MCW1926035.1 hypothetical protein [Luteolibacter arcticus]
MKALPLLLLMLASVAQGDALRISEVREVAGEDTERMTLSYRIDGENKEEQLFILKEVMIGDGDVAQASVGPGGTITVKLKPEGARVMAEATGNMIPGRSRLALIVDGKLVSAPGIREPLGGEFEISGVDDLDGRGLENLARRMSGRPVLDPKEEVPQAPPPPRRPETVPFTEEEYQQNKAAREKAGIYHLESIPSQEELDAKLQKGMDREAVIAALGKPCYTSGKPEDGKIEMIYEIAPEKRDEVPDGGAVRDGFSVRFSESKVVGWDFSSSNIPRDRKVVGRVPGLLVASYPKVDFSSDDIDVIALLEGVKIPDIRQKVNATDLAQLLSLAMMTSHWENAVGKEQKLSTRCDFMKILALHFPEVQALADRAVDGKLPAKSLGAALSPYFEEGKPLPGAQVAPSEKGR